jgi:predicted permease
MQAQLVAGRDLLQSPGTSWLRIIGRLKPGVAVSQAETVLTVMFRHILTETFGPAPSEDIRRDIQNESIRLISASTGVSRLRGPFMRPLQVLLSVVVLVLLIACANIANLLLARASARRREIGLRLALGVSQGRLVRQLLVESVVLAALGGAAGMLVARAGTETLLRMASADGARLPVMVATDARLMTFVALVSLGACLLFGLAPAWQALRVDVLVSLGNVRQGAGRSRPLLGRLLVVTQVAVSLVLLVGAGLFLRTLANLRSVDPGFAPDRLLVVDVNPTATGYNDEAAIAVNRRLMDRLRTVPGVASVSLSENGVLLGRDSSTNLIRPAGALAGPDGYPPSCFDVVGPGYFSTMGIQLVIGRDINERDDERTPRVVVINEAMARKLFADVNPVGERLVWQTGGSLKDFEVIAVARDVKHRTLRDEPQLRFYVPYFQMPLIRDWQLASTRFVVRTTADPVAALDLIKHAVLAENPRLEANLSIAPDLVDATLVQERMVAKLSAWFGGFAVALACLGLYGLISYQVVQRTSEIGVRMALGAQRGHVLRAVLRQTLTWIAAGIALGVPLALSLSRFAQSLLFGLDATDVSTLTLSVSVLSALGLVAGYLPARRAARVDPLVALRYE